MKNSAPRLDASNVRTRELATLIDAYLIANEVSQLSQRTIGNRRDILRKLRWFAVRTEAEELDTHTLREFLRYISNAHNNTEGRWGNPDNNQPVRPRTVRDYHSTLRAWFNWLKEEGEIEASPLERIPAPVSRADQIQPFLPEEIRALLQAAKLTPTPRRDEAILLLLLDTGMRASELTELTCQDVDITLHRARVHGKGDKSRTVGFSSLASRAIRRHLATEPRNQTDLLFTGQRGPLTRSGLLQIISNIGNRAGVQHAHPHRLRHTFAVTFLKAGGNAFALQALLGHTNLQMTQRYVAYAQADVELAAQRYSPVEHLLGKRRHT